MTAAASASAGRPQRLLRQLGFACAVSACVALPALVAGVNIDGPAAPGELERLRAAIEGTCPSRLAAWFQQLTAPAVSAWPDSVAGRESLLASARLAQVLGLLALGMLVYLTTLLARGRLAALAACVGLSFLPASMVQGYVLRPETAAAVLTALGLVLLQCLASPVRRPEARSPLRRAGLRLAISLSAAIAFGLAFAAAPGLADPLMLAPVLATFVAARLGLRGVRVLRARGVGVLPSSAITAQLWPPTLAAFGTFVMALVCLQASRVPGTQLGTPTQLAVGMWPDSWLGAGLLLAFCALGVLSFLLHTGVRFGRRGRVGADLVLLLYCITLVLRGLLTDERLDPLPSAPAVAILFGEGVLASVSFFAWLARRRATS